MRLEDNVSISTGNTKMGQISSVSLPSRITCAEGVPCSRLCYAAKLERIRASVREAYAHNLQVLKRDPERYWREVEGAIMMSRFFRFHVSGDIPDKAYLKEMVDVAERNPHCQILCFTKRYELVSVYYGEHRGLPENLHIILSVWRDYPYVNPYRLPEAHVRYKDGTTTARKRAKTCKGNCAECARVGEGCWSLEKGQQVVFDQH